MSAPERMSTPASSAQALYCQRNLTPSCHVMHTALYSFNPLSVLVLGYIVHMVYGLSRRAKQVCICMYISIYVKDESKNRRRLY